MRAEDAFCKASGLEQAEAEQDCVPHAGPYRVGNIPCDADVADQCGINRDADQNQKRLQAERGEGFQVTLSHVMSFSAHHRRHRNRRD